jgi:Triose-phosphate Transporter family
MLTAVLSAVVLKQTFPVPVYKALTPVVAGLSLASAHEVTY